MIDEENRGVNTFMERVRSTDAELQGHRCSIAHNIDFNVVFFSQSVEELNRSSDVVEWDSVDFPHDIAVLKAEFVKN